MNKIVSQLNSILQRSVCSWDDVKSCFLRSHRSTKISGFDSLGGLIHWYTGTNRKLLKIRIYLLVYPFGRSSTCGLKCEFPVLSLPLPICVISKSQPLLTILHKLALIHLPYLLANTCSWRSTEWGDAVEKVRDLGKKKYQTFSSKSIANVSFLSICVKVKLYMFFLSIYLCIRQSFICQFDTFSLTHKINLCNPYPEKNWNGA